MTDEKALIVIHENCGACHICELICSFSKEGVFAPSRSRIRIKEAPMDETILVCQHCKVTKCVDACVYGALSRNPSTGAIIVDQEKCKGLECGECLKVCPYGSIFMDPKNGRIFVCDLCEGDPVCVKWCPRSALLFEVPRDEKYKLKQKAENKIVTFLRGVKR